MATATCPKHNMAYDPTTKAGCYVCGMEAMSARIEERRRLNPVPPTCTSCGDPGTYHGSYHGISPDLGGTLAIREICPSCEATLQDFGLVHKAEHEAMLAAQAERDASRVCPYTRTPNF